MGGSYPYKWDEKYCDMLVEHMGKGLSIEAFAGEVGVTRDCVYKWIDRHECFSEAFKKGKAKQHAFFEKMGLHAMTGKIKNFNQSVYIFTLKNKLKWKDTVDTNIASEGLKVEFVDAKKNDD